MSSIHEILKQLDDNCQDNFPTMDHPDNFLGETRLAAFGNGMLWSMTIEQLVFATAAGGYYKFRTWIYTYGNCLIGAPGARSADAIHTISEGIDGVLFEDVMYIRQNVRSLRIRGRLVHFDPSPQSIASRGIDLVFPPKVGGWDLLRLLALDYRDQLLATDAERRKRIAVPLPQLLKLDEWHHPDIMRGEKPSDTACFRSLAELLSKGDPSLYRPTEPANTHWRNWPHGG